MYLMCLFIVIVHIVLSIITLGFPVTNFILKFLTTLLGYGKHFDLYFMFYQLLPLGFLRNIKCMMTAPIL